MHSCKSRILLLQQAEAELLLNYLELQLMTMFILNNSAENSDTFTLKTI